MAMPLSIQEVEKLVAARVHELGRGADPKFVHVFEDADSSDGVNLVIQIAAARPNDRAAWIRTRMKFVRQIRDLLIQKGDARYPLLQVFEPSEWAARDA